MGLLSSVIGAITDKYLASDTKSLYYIDKVTTAMDLSWDYNTTFRITEMFNRSLSTVYKSQSMFNGISNINDVLNRHIVSVHVPAAASTPLDAWGGNEWMYTNGRPVVAQVVVTFTDFNNDKTSNTLYKEFTRAFNIISNAYPDEQKWNLDIGKVKAKNIGMPINGSLTPPVGELNESDFVTVVSSPNAILESISELRFDQTNTEISTFDVTFKYHLRY